jgi:hypothetical protein
MNFLNVVWIILFLGTLLQADPVQQSTILGLKAPSSPDAVLVRKMESIGFGWWLHHRPGMLAEESLRVVGSFTVVKPIKNFADSGNTVWEVRVMRFGPNPELQTTGVLWINEKTEKVLGLGIDLPNSN